MERTTRFGVGGPLGKGDFEKGRRLGHMLGMSERYANLGIVPMFELKGDDLSGGWVQDLYAQIKPFGGVLTWHWSPKSTKKLGDLAEPVSEQLKAMASQAKILKETVDLAAVTIHCAPAQAVDPPADAGMERYNSPIGAAEMFGHIVRQVKPIRALNEATGGILHVENVDITNFRDGGYKLPTYLTLQTGSFIDLIWLAREAGTHITFDSEHFFCAGNLLYRRRDMKDLPAYAEPQTVEEAAFAAVSRYWLRQGYAPEATVGIDIASFVMTACPRLFHIGGAIQAEIDGQIGTHLPLDWENSDQMGVLDFQLQRIMANDFALGAIHEVVGQNQYADDPANPGHNRYSPWSTRIEDDEAAKEKTLEVILDRISGLTNYNSE